MSDWEVVYETAIQEDGSLFFPERLSQDFLDKARRTMGSYLFANQYQNEVIPAEAKTFKKHWLRYYSVLPQIIHTFAFLDPAISEADTADYTGVVVVSVDQEQNWYVRHAARHRWNPTQLINACFEIQGIYKPQVIGIEDVAFQRVLVHFTGEEMKRRQQIIPVTGIPRTNQTTKEARILGLVPRFEWGSLYLAQGLADLEIELAKFPRAAHDDILDALSSISEIVFYPPKARSKNEAPNTGDPGYESWYIKQLVKRSNATGE